MNNCTCTFIKVFATLNFYELFNDRGDRLGIYITEPTDDWLEKNETMIACFESLKIDGMTFYYYGDPCRLMYNN